MINYSVPNKNHPTPDFSACIANFINDIEAIIAAPLAGALLHNRYKRIHHARSYKQAR